MEQPTQLVNLISEIKHICLNHNDLLEVSLDYSTTYFRNKKEEEKEFDIFWANPIFIEQAVNAAREGIVLSMQAITLDEKLPFDVIIDRCVDLEMQRYNEPKISEKPNDIDQIKNFLSSLRKELFSRIYSQNKELQKVSKIPLIVLKSRYDYFMNKEF